MSLGTGNANGFLSTINTQEEFLNAVKNAHFQMFGSAGLPYNIDAFTYLSVAIECCQYATAHMKGLPRFGERLALLDYCVDKISFDGLILEFGVFSGQTINRIASRKPQQKIFGFDSFKGLPEDWASLPKGAFGVEQLPTVLENVELVVGFFDRTLPRFAEDHAGNISLLHVDCDLYSSTQTIFNTLRDRIVTGTVIVFDEYWNYPDWKKHEFLAFQEFISYTGKKYNYIGLVPQYEHVAAVIL